MAMLTVDDLARDLKVRNEDLLRELVTMGYEVEGPESPLETEDPAQLRARLVDVLPQREVVEKRIKPTVIRRRMKKLPTPLGQEEAPVEQVAAEPQETREAPREPAFSQETRQDDAGGLASRKPAKKVRRPEAARIIELAPSRQLVPEEEAAPEPSTPMPVSTAPGVEEPTPREVDEVIGRAVVEQVTEMEPPSPSEVVETSPKTEEAEIRVVGPADSQGEPVKQEPAQAQEKGAAPSAAGEERPVDERRAYDERAAKKKKRKDKRMQPAQIIGRVELKKEPPKEVERPEPPAPPPPPPQARPVRTVEPPRPAVAVAMVEPVTEEERRKKSKKPVKKGRDVKETVVEDDKLKVRRRKEVVLGTDLYDDRPRGGRLRGRGKKARPRKTEITTPKASKRRIKLPDVVTVANLAHKMSVKASELIQHLMTLGVTASINEFVDFDTASICASEFGFEAEPAGQSEQSMLPATIKDTVENLVSRPPVITVMGHVDHGKTSLLDAIRSTHVTAQEAGGITQHIGAYKVKLDKGELVFLDTPGHEAFTAMRARGAHVTDFVVLVVAADDGVMEQTREAINHARAANVPIIVAVNKIDKPDADRDKVIRELSEHNLIPESWGGDTVFTFVSAKTYEGVDEFLDLILLQSELMELKANPNKKASGTVVEARLDKGRGAVATVLVREGTLRLGDAFVSGLHHGKVRAMVDHEGRSVEEAGPAMPVEVQGFSGVPEAGELFLVVEEEKIARQISEHRLHKQKELEAAGTGQASLEDLMARMLEAEAKELNLILKGDVQGSVEALKESLLGIPSQEIKVKVIHSGVGSVTESDVMLASASNATIIGFNVRPAPKTTQLAEQEKVETRFYTVIYEAIEDVRKAMEGMLAPIEKETITGRAEVRQTFQVPKIGVIAGCYITSGKVERSNQVRLLRDNVVVHQGKIGSMRRFKDDVKEALEGYECGISLENYKDIKVGDIIEAYVIEQESAKLV
jgi:translation initiation factor IF-2